MQSSLAKNILLGLAIGDALGVPAEFKNREPYTIHDCFIDGIACHADEARLGGIVVEK